VKAIGAILVTVGTVAIVGYLAMTLITQQPVTTGIFACVIIGALLLEKR
jgi:hypothetical protein